MSGKGWALLKQKIRAYTYSQKKLDEIGVNRQLMFACVFFYLLL